MIFILTLLLGTLTLATHRFFLASLLLVMGVSLTIHVTSRWAPSKKTYTWRPAYAQSLSFATSTQAEDAHPHPLAFKNHSHAKTCYQRFALDQKRCWKP
jgi:hypothetical protein